MRDGSFGSIALAFFVKVRVMSKTILIQDPDVVISLDLAQTVMETWPDARVILCRDVPQILAVLTEGQHPDLVIMRQSWRSAESFGLTSLLAQSPTKVVLTGADEDDRADVATLGWHELEMPFLAPQIRTALHSVWSEVAPDVESL